MTYDPTTLPLRPGRVITVSGPVDLAVNAIAARFAARGFRVKSAAGTMPLVLELGRWYAPYLLWGSVLPAKLSGPAKHGVVHVDLETNADSSLAFTIRSYYAWSAQLFSPIMLETVDQVVATFTSAGVLVDAGPIIATKGRL